MVPRRALLPLVAVAGLALLAAEPAEAAPLTAYGPTSAVAYHGGAHAGFGIHVPLGKPYRYRAPAYPAGRWVVRYDRVWIPGAVIGYDAYGHPVYGAGYWAVRPHRVWVPGPRWVHPARPRGHVSLGFHFR